MEFDFSQNATVESIDRVPEQFRGLYQEADGKVSINPAFKGVAEALDGLNKTTKKIRKDLTDAGKKAVDLSPIGQLLELEGEVSVDAVRSAIEKIRTEGKDGKVNWDKMKTQLEAAHASALKGKDGEIEKARGSVVKYLVESAAVTAIAESKGVPELLLPQIKAQTKVVLDGDEYVVRVVDQQGDPRGDGKGGFMSVADLVKEMKSHAVYGRAFESEAPQGGGKPPARQQSGPANVPGQQKSSIQKITDGLSKR